MKTKFIEAVQDAKGGLSNWGKFVVSRFEEEEWERPSEVGRLPLLTDCGWWSRDVILVVDLQTGEGCIFSPGGSARADLMKHKVWVCPMFEPFLVWLYKQDLSDLGALPGLVELPDAPFEMAGYRRPGKTGG